MQEIGMISCKEIAKLSLSLELLLFGSVVLLVLLLVFTYASIHTNTHILFLSSNSIQMVQTNPPCWKSWFYKNLLDPILPLVIIDSINEILLYHCQFKIGEVFYSIKQNVSSISKH